MQDPDFDELSKLPEPIASVSAAAMAQNLLCKGIMPLYKQHIGAFKDEDTGPTRPEAPGGEY